MNLDEMAGRVYEERQRLNMSRPDVEQKSGISWHTVERFENGAGIQLTSLLMIADALGLEVVVQERKP